MRGDPGQGLARGNVDGRAVGVFHSSARTLRRFANVQDEQVAVEGRASHQLHFVRADSFEHGFYVGLLPVVAVDGNGDGTRAILYRKGSKYPYFHGAVAESVV